MRTVEEICKVVGDTSKPPEEIDAFIDSLSAEEIRNVLKESARVWAR